MINIAATKAPFLVMLPHNDEAEHMVLGALIADERCWHEVNSLVSVDDLYRDSSRQIWLAAEHLQEKNVTIDVITLADVLSARGQIEGIGGTRHLMTLANGVASVSNVSHWCRLVKDCSLRRMLIAEADRMRQHASDRSADVSEVIRTAQDAIGVIVQASCQTKGLAIGEGIPEWKDAFIAKMCDPIPATLTTSIPALDAAITGGLQRNRAILFAGYQKSGKSKGALQIAAWMAKHHGAHVEHYSTEMIRPDLLTRLISHEARYPEHVLSSPPRQPEGRSASTKEIEQLCEIQTKVVGAMESIREYGDRWVLYTHPRPKLSEIIATTHARRAQLGPDVPMILIIDYVQEIDAGASPNKPETRRLNAEAAAPQLVAMCNQLNVLGILVAHLNRPDKKAAKLTPPHQDDVYGSAAWAKAVDHSVMIWQPLADEAATSAFEQRAQQYTEWRVGRSRHNAPAIVRVRADHARNFVEPWIGPYPDLENFKRGQSSGSGGGHEQSPQQQHSSRSY